MELTMAKGAAAQRRRRVVAHATAHLLTAAMILAAGGCGWSNPEKDGFMRPTMTREEAVDRVERHTKQAVAQLPGEAWLTVTRKTDKMPCGLWDDEDGDTRVRVEHGYWIDGIPKEKNQQYFDAVRKYWKERGYRELEFEKRQTWSMVYQDSENFTLDLATSYDGRISILVTSPCVWPNGTADVEVR